jgi:hypothetical protein
MANDDVGASQPPSGRLVEQRVRNRIIEYLELASSFEAQREYERNVPIAHVPYEVINQWDDQVWTDPRENPYNLDIYDEAEVEALAHSEWTDKGWLHCPRPGPLSSPSAPPLRGTSGPTAAGMARFDADDSSGVRKRSVVARAPAVNYS